MPPLANARHERFAQNLTHVGMSQGDAYQEAGYQSAPGASAYANASRLIRNDKVESRVDELKAATSKAASLTRADILQMMEDDRQLARECKQSAAAIRAGELLGKELHGMFKDHAQIDIAGQWRGKTESELVEQLAKEFEALGLASLAAQVRSGDSLADDSLVIEHDENESPSSSDKGASTK